MTDLKGRHAMMLLCCKVARTKALTNYELMTWNRIQIRCSNSIQMMHSDLHPSKYIEYLHSNIWGWGRLVAITTLTKISTYDTNTGTLLYWEKG